MQVPYYTALAMQSKCLAVNKYTSRSEVIAHMERLLDKLSGQIYAAKKFIGSHLKLVVVPEYFLTSYPLQESISVWRDKACISKDDAVFTKIGEMCKAHDIFFSGNYYEQDANFPNLFFQASFIVDDQGEMVLNYRRLNSMYSPTPHDVLDKYIDLYGKESLFPVADTKLGKLACIASEEILYPEVARCLMMRGAEVFLHSSSEIGSPILTRKNICKRARAIENMAYVISANSAGIEDTPILSNSTDGRSQVVHFEGHLLAEASPGESIVANASIDINALRAWRKTVSMKNYIARQRFELYADSYASHSHYPVNVFDEVATPKKSQFKAAQQEAIDRIYK